jgi:preprotein translocase subunit SecB
MANDKTTPDATPGNGGASPGETAPPRLSLRAQYTKDLSFENPNSPQSLTGAAAPEVSVNVDVGARAGEQSLVEVSLRITANAKRGEQVAFVVELDYAGLFTIENIPREHLEAVCLIECPRLLFPFARRIIADATRDGGFPPLMLELIDFSELYRRSKQKRAAETAAKA